MAKFEIGDVVLYKGKKWEIADHLTGTYALWTPDHKQEIDGWIPADQLAKDDSQEMSLNTEKQHIDNIINRKYLQKEPEPRGLRSPKPGNSCIGENQDVK